MKVSAIGAVMAIAASIGLAPSARADIIDNYAFSAGAGYTGFRGDSASLSGTFSWDATLNKIIASDINLTGFDATGGHGAVSCSNCTTGIYDSGGAHYFAINLGPEALYTTYLNSLELDAVDPLALSVYGGANRAEYQGGAAFNGVTGSVVPVSVPEPASMALFGSALLMLGAIRRRNSRA